MEIARVYGHLTLPDVRRVLACLHEKEVRFEAVDGSMSYQDLPLFFKLQATGHVPADPAFEDGQTKLFDSRVICRYVAEKYVKQGNQRLLGRDFLERASIERWLKLEENRFEPPSSALVFHLAFAPHFKLKPDRVLIEKSERDLMKVLDIYDQRLSENRFLAGEEFTLADLFHLPNSDYIINSTDKGYLFSKRKNVSRWWEDISTRPSWKKCHQTFPSFHIFHYPSIPNHLPIFTHFVNSNSL
ncbi:Glutathione S-transferase F11 [Acorus calamus]|uniref:glutathione transferase n=1 Tax=Acorus calamus TaxID=4465 RepID=A0AAV9D724_ACOCL|nr:Glutathione S-transferase F11 [Acorus calamus]